MDIDYSLISPYCLKKGSKIQCAYVGPKLDWTNSEVEWVNIDLIDLETKKIRGYNCIFITDELSLLDDLVLTSNTNVDLENGAELNSMYRNMKCGSRVYIRKHLKNMVKQLEASKFINIESSDSLWIIGIKLNELDYTKFAHLQVKRSPLNGLGLFAREDIAMSSKILTLSGRIVTGETPELNSEWHAVDENTFIVRDRHTLYHFINHSRNNNLRLVYDGSTVHVVATKNIAEGDEVVLNYAYESLPEEYLKINKGWL